MECEPPVKALVVQAAVAVPVVEFQLLTVTAPDVPQLVIALPLSVKVTVPESGTPAPAEAETVAVKVTESPTLDVLFVDDDTNAVVVLAWAIVTVTAGLAGLV